MEELFCQLLVAHLNSDLKKLKEMLQFHFHETQTRPEFIYHLILTLYRKGGVRKALQLMEQFMLKGENGSGADRLYRQSKIPSLMLIRLKVLVNHYQDF
jgi:hypothetical protein